MSWAKRNPEKALAICQRYRATLDPETERAKKRGYSLSSKYGISQEQYDAALKAQGGVCAICGGVNPRRRLAVDHCHSTNINRGLLCSLCNKALERVERDPEWGTKALNYLSKHLTVEMEAEHEQT